MRIYSIKRFFFALLFNGMLATPLLAQYNETIRTDRPGISIGPFAVGKNVLQVQTGPTLGGVKYSNSFERKSDIIAESTVIRFGLTRTLEVSTAFAFRKDKTEYRHSSNDRIQSGLSQADVGFRVNLYEGQGIVPAVGFQTHLKLNILSEDFDTDYPGIACLLTTTQNLTPNLALTTNFGGVWDNSSAGPQGMYTINLSFPVAGKLGGFVENYGSFQDGGFITLFDAGMGLLLSNDLQLDISGGYGKNDGITEYFVDAGVSWRFFVTKNQP